MDFRALHKRAETVEDAAEEFVFGRTPAHDRVGYERHLLSCTKCAQAVADVLEFIRLLRKVEEETRV
jgi:hypothetical protein